MNNSAENIPPKVTKSALRTMKCNERFAREKPGKDIIEPAIEYIPPERNMENFIVSKGICKTLGIFPHTQTIYFNAERKHIEALKEFNYITKKWNDKLKEVEEAEKENEEKIKSIIKDQTKLWKTHIEFEELVVSNVYKKSRCKRILKDSERIFKEREIELENLEKRTEKFKRARESLLVNVEKYKIYSDFLEKILLVEPKFKNTDNIVKRYDEFSTTRKSIVEEQTNIITSLDELRHEKACSLEMKKTRLMTFENELRILEEKYNYARKVTFYWERMLCHARTGFLNRMLEIERVVQCGYNMYEDICCRTGSPLKITIHEKLKLFRYLKIALQFYEEVAEVAMALYEKQLSSEYVATDKAGHTSAYRISKVLDNENKADKSYSFL